MTTVRRLPRFIISALLLGLGVFQARAQAPVGVGIGTTQPYSRLSLGTGGTAGNDRLSRIANYEDANGTYFYGTGLARNANAYGLGLWGGSGGSLPWNGTSGQLPHLFVESTGRVGIGTLTPDRLLTLQAPASGDLLSLRNSAGTTLWHWTLNSGGLNLAESGVADGRLYLAPGGNVGLGTINPQARLHVAGGLRLDALAGTGTRMLTVDLNGTLGATPLPVNTDNQTLSVSGTTLSISGGNSVSLPGGSDNLGNHTATQNLNLGSNLLTGGGSSGLRVSGTGQVGIGTTLPTAPLHVAGVASGPVYTGTYGPNLALGASVSATSGSAGATIPANAADGNYGSYWSISFHNAPAYVQLTLSEPKVIRQYVLASDARQWEFQGWTGSAWVTLDQMTVSTEDTYTRTLTNTTAYQRYRAYITNTSSGMFSVRVTELEIREEGFIPMNVPVALRVSAGGVQLETGPAISGVSTDAAMTDNADYLLPTQKAVRAYLSANGDNLGNGVASTNVNLNGNLLTGGGSTGLSVAANGNVGVGTTAPTAPLQVSGPAIFNGSFGTNVAPTATMTASSITAAGASAANLIDGDWLTLWQSSNAQSSPQWAQFDFGSSPRLIRQYRFYQHDWLGRPAAWSFQGSNNGSTWVTLHSIAGNTSRNVWLSYNFTNTTAYRYYRILLTAHQVTGINNYDLGDVELREEGIAGAGLALRVNPGGLQVGSGAVVNTFSTDGTLAGNSDATLPTEQAVKTYVDARWTRNGSELATTATEVGIGTSTPTAPLHVAADPANGYTTLLASGNGSVGTALTLSSPGNRSFSLISTAANAGIGAGRFGLYDETGSAYRWWWENTGPSNSMFVVNGRLRVVGEVSFCGGSYTCSDRRYKKDIAPLQSALRNVLRMNGYTYYWRRDEFKDKGFTADKQLGFIAQEVEQVYPEMVLTDAETGYKSVDYAKLTPVLVEAIKELHAKLEATEQKLRETTADNAALRQQAEASALSVEARLRALEQALAPRASR